MDLHSKLCWIPCVDGVVSNLLDVTMRGFIYKIGPEDLLFKQALIGDTNIVISQQVRCLVLYMTRCVSTLAVSRIL
jgi:hypothetical protein